jgi:hypothetical protein
MNRSLTSHYAFTCSLYFFVFLSYFLFSTLLFIHLLYYLFLLKRLIHFHVSFLYFGLFSLPSFISRMYFCKVFLHMHQTYLHTCLQFTAHAVLGRLHIQHSFLSDCHCLYYFPLSLAYKTDFLLDLLLLFNIMFLSFLCILWHYVCFSLSLPLLSCTFPVLPVSRGNNTRSAGYMRPFKTN